MLYQHCMSVVLLLINTMLNTALTLFVVLHHLVKNASILYVFKLKESCYQVTYDMQYVLEI